MSQSKNLRWALNNLVGILALIFLLKDFCVIRYLSSRNPSFETDRVSRIGTLPGSLLFWGFAWHVAPLFNILFGALVGWIISRMLRRRNE